MINHPALRTVSVRSIAKWESSRDDNDERIEDAVDEMLTKLWEEIDGKRN